MSEPQSGGAGDGAERLNELVFLYLEERDQGLAATLAEFERRHPKCGSAVRARIQALERTGLIEDAPDGQTFPAQLGDFRLIERRGGGGMGVVYAAEQVSLGRRVALKLIRPEQLFFPRARERFKREIEAVAKLAHPGIVTVYACGEDHGLPYYAMELVEGAPLSAVLLALAGRAPETLDGQDLARALSAAAEGAPVEGALFQGSWVEACLGLARQVALALQHAHERDVLHRDVKPSNILLTPDGRARLVDFGLASSAGSARLTRTGAQVGSIAYMPPEQAGGRIEGADARSDVYSLGVTLYELLTLRLPYTAPSSDRLVRHILAGRAVPARSLNSAVPADAETVCALAMDVDPARRYASAGAFARDLTCVLELRPIAARPASGWLKARRWAQRDPARAAAAGLAALLVVGGPLGFGLVQRAAAQQERALKRQVSDAKDALQRTNADLAQANGALEEKQGELQDSLEREREQRLHAQQGFARARLAIDQMLYDVGSVELGSVPQMEPVRQKLFEKALSMYQSLQDESPTDVGVRRGRALTERSFADLQRDLGRFAQAEQHYVAATAGLRELVAADSTDNLSQHALASCLSQQAGIEHADGRRALAEEHWQEAFDLLEELVAAFGDITLYARDLCVLAGNLGYARFARGDIEGSLPLYERGVELARRLQAREPGVPGYGRLLASWLQHSATVLSHLNRPEESLGRYREACAAIEAVLARDPHDQVSRKQMVQVASNYGMLLLLREDAALTERVLRRGHDVGSSLAAEFPLDPENHVQLAVLSLKLAEHLDNSGSRADAAAICEGARDVLDRLAREHPEQVEYPRYLGTALASCAAASVDLGNLEQAESQSERGLGLLREALARTGGNSSVRASLGYVLFEHANVRRARGDLPGALASIDEALGLGIAQAGALYRGVVVLGQCARDARARPDQTGEAGFVDRALSALRAAIAGGFADATRLRNSPELEPLRARAEFAQILAELSHP